MVDDEQRLKVINAMRKLHRACGAWLTVSSIAEATGMATATAKQVVLALSADGWLKLRDADKANQWLAIQLKKEYR